MSRQRHILICDDEPDLREMVGQYLQKRGYKVTLAENGRALEQKLSTSNDFDAIVLDINMPGDDGLTVLRRLRDSNDIPVLMLSAAGESVDRIIGLEMGADDYLGKPVDLRELDARIKSVLKRFERTDNNDESNTEIDDRVMVDGLTIDFAAANVLDRDGTPMSLTAMELRLLRAFINNQGRVLNRDQLLELAHDRGWDPFDRSIDIRVSRLRRKIERDASQPKLIRTIRGIGYIFDPGESVA